MACCNIWGTAWLNFGTNSIQHFLADLFLYLSAKNVEDVLEFLEQASVSLFKWFENNLLKGNADKCQFLVSCKH